MVLNDSEKAFVSAQFPRALRDQLARSARSHDRSVSGELREAVRQHVQSKNQESAPAAATSSAVRSSAPSERDDARASQLAGRRPSPGAPDVLPGPPAGAEAA